MCNFSSRSAWLTLLLTLAAPTTILAQTENTAELRGVVLDASGHPAAGYPLKLSTPQWGLVLMQPTENNGTLEALGLPPGNYELQVFQPGGSTDTPIASKKVILAAGQKEQIEIRLGSGSPVGIAGTTTLASSGVNWTAIGIAGLTIVAALAAFFTMRPRRRPSE